MGGGSCHLATIDLGYFSMSGVGPATGQRFGLLRSLPCDHPGQLGHCDGPNQKPTAMLRAEAESWRPLPGGFYLPVPCLVEVGLSGDLRVSGGVGKVCFLPD